MTRVLLDPSLLDYRQSMAELVDQLRNEKTDRLAKPPLPKAPWQASEGQKDISGLAFRAGLLTPPKIERLDVSGYEGRAGDIIQIITWDDFGLEGVHVSISDKQGHIIESDYALENPDYTGHWVYFATVSLPSNMFITISANALDSLGGVGIKSYRMTIP